MNKQTIKLTTILTSLLLSACGGGGSDSGPSTPPPPLAAKVMAGVYSGTVTTTFTGPRVDDTPSEGPFRITVVGQITGQQQVIIAYRQWSGSSAVIIPNNTFSIPSGTFFINNDYFGRCEVNVTFEGSFDGTTASGTGNGTYQCSRASGPITQSSSFTVSHGNAAKSLLNGDPQPIER